MEGIEPKDTNQIVSSLNKYSYGGCISALALDSSRIKVTFSYPADASEIEVYRDGLKVLTTHNSATNFFIDTGLEEGETYNYICIAKINDTFTEGANDVTETTAIITPPQFLGITSATALSPTSVYLTWAPSSGGSKVKYYKIFSAMDKSLDFNLQHRTTSPEATYSITLTGLADDMPYEFGVRACNASDVCDGNVNVKSLITADSGSPSTSGPSSFNIENSVVSIQAPWVEENGAIAKRELYRATSIGGMYTKIKTIDVSAVSNLGEPSLYILDNTALENTTYYYKVYDVDPSGNSNYASAIITVPVGDLSAPPFTTGLNSISHGLNKENNIDLTFTAIDHQPNNINGAANYLLFRTFSDGGIPSDPCSSNNLIKTISATPYNSGDIGIINELGISRRTYSYCLKANDNALNISNTTTTRTITMKDLTPPSFDGVQDLVFNSGASRFEVVWNSSSSADIKYYRVKIWKNLDPNIESVSTIDASALHFNINHTSNPNGYNFDTGTFSYNDGDTVYTLVDACDNAYPNYNTSDNCTSYSYSAAKFRTLSDNTPPPIVALLSVVNDGEARLKVTWGNPPANDWSDYERFKIYDISSGTKLLLEDCVCPSGAGCSPTINSCTISGAINQIKAKHSYKIVVAPADQYGNEAYSLANIATLDSVDIPITTIDLTKPNFTSNLTLQSIIGNNATISWDPAFDNQSQVEPGNVIRYYVYRKFGSFFNDSNNPENDGLLLNVGGTTLTSFVDDTSSWNPGVLMYYTICSEDSSGNRLCNGNVSGSIDDNVKPTISLRIDDTINSGMFQLKGLIEDNSDPQSSISVRVYRKFSNDSIDVATATDSLVASVLASDSVFDSFTLPISSNHYVHYFVTAQDTAAIPNQQSATLTYKIREPNIGAAQSENVTEDILYHFSINTASASPGNSSTITYELVSAPTNGVLSDCLGLGSTTNTDLSCSYITNPDFVGTDSLEYKACQNGICTELAQTVTFLIANSNDIARATDDSLYVYANNTVQNLDVLNNDYDPDGASFTINPVSGTTTMGRPFNCSATMCTYTGSTSDIQGVDSFTYTLSSGNSATVYIYKYHADAWIGGEATGDWTNFKNWCGPHQPGGNGLVPPCNRLSSAGYPNSLTKKVSFLPGCITCEPIINTTINVQNIHMYKGFNGTLLQNDSLIIQELTWSEDLPGLYIEEGSTFTATLDPAKQLQIRGYLHIGGVFNSTPGDLFIHAYNNNTYRESLIFVLTSTGVFNHNNGTVTLAGNRISTYKIVSYKDLEFYNLKFSNSVAEAVNKDTAYSVENFNSSKVKILNDFHFNNSGYNSGVIYLEGDMYVGALNYALSADDLAGVNSYSALLWNNPANLYRNLFTGIVQFVGSTDQYLYGQANKVAPTIEINKSSGKLYTVGDTSLTRLKLSQGELVVESGKKLGFYGKNQDHTYDCLGGVTQPIVNSGGGIIMDSTNDLILGWNTGTTNAQCDPEYTFGQDMSVKDLIITGTRGFDSTKWEDYYRTDIMLGGNTFNVYGNFIQDIGVLTSGVLNIYGDFYFNMTGDRVAERSQRNLVLNFKADSTIYTRNNYNTTANNNINSGTTIIESHVMIDNITNTTPIYLTNVTLADNSSASLTLDNDLDLGIISSFFLPANATLNKNGMNLTPIGAAVITTLGNVNN